MYQSTVGFRALPRTGKQAVVSLLLPLLSLSFLLSLLSLQPAAAQTLVSNTNNAPTSDPVPVRKNRIQSQSFRTGSVTDGYTLHSIALRFRSLGVDSGGSGRLTVTLRANGSDNRPGHLLHKLNNPFPWRFDGVNVFTAPTDIVLAADTWYHVVAEYSRSSSGPRWARARSGLDSGAADGWQIRSSRYESSGDGNWNARPVLTITVRGLPRTEVTVASDGDVTEGEPAVFTLTRTGDTAQTLDVAYTVTATGDFGVTTGAGTATFLADSSTTQVSVDTTDDSAHEAHGSVTLTLTANPVAYALGTEDEATATVLDDDDSPATGAVTVTGTPTEGETLTADTSGLTDADGLDNAAWAYQWVRTPSGGSDADISGATSQTYVPVFADTGATLKVRVTVTDDEGHEATFTSAPTSAVAALPRPSVTVASDGDVTEGNAAVFTLTRTGDLAEELDVAYAVTATGDFGVTPGVGTATFPANSATVQVTVATTDDSTHEAHGSVTLTLTADTGADPAYLLGDPATATAAVEDDDDSPATGSVTVTGTATEGETLTADTSGLTDADGLDNAAWAYQWVRTPSGGSDADISGATSQTYVPVFADVGATLKAKVTVTDDEGHEATFTSAPTSAVAALPRPVVTVASDGDVTEGSAAEFTLTRTGDLAQTLDVAYTVTASGDFGVAPFSGTATFLANSSKVQVSVATTGDGAHEVHGSVTVTLTADTGADPVYLLGDRSTATAAVEDDDDSPASGSVTVTGTATEGETLSADTSGLTDGDGLDNAAYTYQWVRTPSGGSDADISGATGATYVPVFADVGATLKVKVTVTDDEGHEATFTSAPTSAVAALPRPSVTVVSDGDVTEGSAAVFTLTRTGATAGTLAVAYETTALGDFGVTPGAGTATFPANSLTVQVSVATTGDATHEAHGSVTLTLTADTGADPAYLLGDPATATAAVEDDDDSPATGSVTVTGTATEGETLSADTSGLTDADGLDNAAWVYQWVRTPSGGGDADISGATGATYVAVFADAGATLKVRVTVTDDEGHEATFTSAPTAAVAALPRPSVTVASDGDVTEGSPALFTLTRTGDTTGMLDVAYETTASGDFGVTPGAGTATFPANSLTVQVSVATTGDDTHEAHGSVTVTLTANPVAYDLGDEDAAMAAVRDDDDSPATGAVTITSTPTEGETLSADTSGLTDADGLDSAAYVYQWVRTPSGGGDADISGATGATYVAVFADAGATLKVKVTVTDDEGHQATFTSAPTSAVAALPRPVVTVASDGDVTEGSAAEFTLTRTGDLAQTLDVAYTVTASGDFGVAPFSGTATFLANSSKVQVSVATTGDGAHEVHGSVTVTLTADTGADPVYLLGDRSTATAAVEDDDDSPASGSVTVTGTATEGETLSADTSGLTDGDGLDNAAYTYQWVRTPSGGSDADISGATGATYVPVFADVGATLKVKVTVTDDEGHEATFTSAPTSAVAALPRPSVTVVSDGDVTEGSAAVFTLTRTGDTAQTLDVAYAVTASGDFGVTPGAGTATFPANSLTVQVSVATTGDATHEAHGSVTLTLTTDTGADPAYLLGDPATATAAVEDDDDSPATGSVTVTGTATEGEALTADTSGLTDGDGLDNAAYAYQWVRTPSGGSDADISGATSQTYVPVFADVGATLKVRVTVTDDEGHEATFTSAPTAAVTALPRPEVTVVSDGNVTEGDTVTFTLTRTGDMAGTLDVAYEVTATGEFGVTTGAGTATFLANSSTVQVRVSTTDDTTHEAHGSVTVTLTANPVAYDLGTEDEATATVLDDDDSPATGAVTVTGTPTEGETLTADTSGLTDADGLDNAAWAYQWVRTPSGGSDADISGATSQTYVPVFADTGATLKVRVTVTDDEGHEATFTSAPTSAVAALPRPSVTVASDGDVTEGNAAVFTLTRTGDLAEELDVAYAVTATGDFGVTPGVGTATFPANSATVQVTVATTDDSTHEAHGSVTLTLTADTGADPAYLLGDPSTATAAVEDDDDSPATGSVTVTGTATEGETLTADTSGLTDADGLDNAAYAYQWVRTPSGGSDADISGATSQTYVPVFADAGATLKVKVTVTDDEGHQATFTSAPTSAVAALPRPVVTVASDGDVTEGSAAEFTLTRTGDLAQTLDVAYTVTASGDFGVAPFSGTATFLANSSKVQVSVATTGDGAHEAHGSVTVTLTADTGADPVYLLGDRSTATAAVEDDDDSPASGSVTVTGTATEGETLSADTSGLTDGDGLDNAAYTYQWVRTPSGGSDADISGATGATYVPVFADVGATLKVKVTVTDDEGHEATFTSAPTSAVAALPRPSVTVVSDGDVTEGSAAVFTLTRTGDTAQTLDVAYAVTASGDFGVTPGAGTATFPANSLTVQVSVATTGDATHEAHGSVTLTLTTDTGADPAYLLGDPATAAVEDDDDSPATGSVTVTGTATEGETLTADTSGLTDADGLDNAAWVYQWVRTPSGGGDADISGATSKTYVAVFADAEATLKVKVTVTDDEGHQATFTSAPTAAVAALPRPVVTVASADDVTEGDTVTFTLTRTGDTAGTLAVAYETTALGDFGVTPGEGTATFLANSSTTQVSVDTTDDTTHEAHGSVTVTLTANPVAYDLGDEDAATATVRDDDDSPATGAVTVTGTPTEGETLTADTSGLTDADGLDNAAWVYQWVRTPSGGSDADISGATGATYVAVFADAGATLKVRVTVTDDEGHEATFESAPTAAVAALPRPSVTVVSAGDVTEGSAAVFTLTRTGATAGTLAVAYETTATGSFGVTPGAGTATFLANSSTTQVSVDTTGDDTHEAHGSVTVTLTANPVAYDLGDEDAATVAVRDDDDSPATGAVTVTGTATEGETLSADTSGLTDADGLDSAAWVYQWVRTPSGGSDADISGATGATYVAVFADAGATLKVRVTVTDDEGHQATFTSAPTAAVAALLRPSVTVVSDGDVTEGDTVTFTLTRTGDTAQTLDVAYAVTATGDFGVTTGADTATFLANSSTVQVTAATTDDSTHEAHGSVTVTLTANPVAYDLGAEDAATAAVEDDDDSPATGAVTVTGTATEGETLSADTSGLTDADGLDNAAWVYQWVRTPSGGGDADISGATGATYVAVFADAGATLKVRVTVTDDEGHEATFTSAPTAAVAALPRPSVTVASDGDVTEGSPALFTLTRTGDTTGMLDVAYETTASGDFGVTPGAGTATFPANSLTVQVSVATTGDDTHEAHGSVTVTLTADAGADPAYLLGDPSTATVAVRDDDDSPATGSVTVTGTATEGETLTADTSDLTDGDGLDNAAWAYQWVRTPSGGSDADISGATGATYVPVFADAGATLKVKVTVTDDEGHEATFTSAPTSAVAAASRPSVTVVSDGDVTEGSPALFTLTRTGDTAQTLDVAYTVTATGDFGAATGADTVTFLAGSATVRVSVATTGDGAHEAHGSVTVTLTADTGAGPAYLLGDPSTATAAVRDNDNSPATGAVTITGTPTEGETLTADTSGLTDADGLDNAAWAYQWVRTPAGGSDADISGATSKTYVAVFADVGATLKVRVTVTDDEGHEATFTSAPTAAVAALPRPSVTVASAGDVTEGDTVTFTLTRTGDTAGTLAVAYETTASGDFGVTPGAGTATFLANSSTTQVSVDTTDDTTHEAHGSVTVTLTANPVAYDLGDEDAAMAAVRDDDDSPATGAVTITGTPTEGETLSADTSGLTDADGLDSAAYVYQWVRTPSGGGDADISGATGATYVAVFADAGATLKVRVTVTDDEGHEATFESAPTAAVAALPRPSVTVVSAGDVTEGSAAVFTLTRTGATAGTLAVAYETTATGSFGVTPGAGTATFLANSSTTQVSVDTTGDDTHEAHGSVTVTLTANPVAYDLGDEDAATVAVRDDDDSPATGAVTVTGTATEGETLSADTSGLTDADGLDSAAWVYQWVRTPSGGSDADISGATGATYVAVFADAGATLKVRVTVTDDEGHQATFTSAPTAAVAALLRPSVTVVSDGDVTEGDTVTFTLTRTGDTAQTLDVAYAVTATGDFGVTTGADTATFLANSSTVQVTAATTDDSTHEAHGSVTVTLTADTGADPAYLLGDPATATAAVEDDDDSPASGSVTVTGTATEGETLTADTSGLTDADGLDNAAWAYQWVRTPSEGNDADISGATSKTYVPVFADAGATLKVRVTVTDDEGHQATFTSAPTAAVAALPRPEVTVASDGDVTEGDTVTFTLTRTGDPAQTLDVAYTLTASGDFGVTPGADTATFEAGKTVVQVTVPTTGDDTHEAHGSVTLTLTANPIAYDLGTEDAATAAVRDDDDSPATGAVKVTGTATEGETLTADTSGLTDADGLANAAWAYQWVRTPSGGSDVDISGATGATYVPVFADVGATLKVKVAVTDDEGHEATFTSAPTSAVAAAPRPSVTVASDGDVTEGSPALFTLTRTGDTAQTLDVAYTVTATGDFGAATGADTVTFLAGSATVRVSVATTGDGAHEAHGSVTVTLTADTGAGPAYLLGDPSTATAAVRDNDNSPATGAVTITGTPTEGETLTADTSGLTDADGLDNAAWAYQWVRTPAGGSDADISGATSKTYVAVFADVGATLKVKVTVTDDEGHEATFTSAPTSAVAAASRPSVTVVSDGDVTEGSAAVFTLTRTGDTAQTLDVAYTVTATGSFGVTPGAGTATFLANSSTTQVSVDTTDDTTHEAHGSVTVTLTANPVAYDLGDEDAATATVRDDDDSPATGAVTVTGTPTEGETLTADTSGLTDADGLDNAAWVYQWVRTPSGGGDADISGATGATYVAVFADAGATLKVRVTVTDDEGHEATFTSAPTAAVAALPRPSVTVASDGDVTEGSPALFTLTRTGDTTGMLDVAYETTASGDFGVTPGADTTTFEAGKTVVQVTVPTTGDDTHEAHGSVTLTLTANPVAYDLGTEDTATAAVEDDDDSPATGSVTVTGTATEGETLTADTSGLTDADGLANAAWAYQWVRTPSGGSDADISGATGATYVPAFADVGATLKVKVTVTDDEGHEATFTSAPTAAVAALPRPEVTVVSDGDVTEGDTVTFTLTRTGDTTGMLDVAYETTASGDFGVTPGADTTTFEAGKTVVQVTVPTTGDDTHEAHGSVTVTLTANPIAYDLGTEDAAMAAVRDDDDSPATGSVTVTGTATEGETLTADTSGLTDADGLDNAAWAYQWMRTPSGDSDADISGAISKTYVAVFADAGATLKVRVTITDDEGHQATFTSAPTAVVTALKLTMTLSVSPEVVSEGAGEPPVMVTVTATGSTRMGEARTVTVSVIDSGEEAAVDYAAIKDFEIVVPAGAPGTSASAQFALVPEDDMVDEADATLRVSGSVDGVTMAEAMLTLTDNDEAPTGIELSVSPDTVSEGAGETTVTVTATVADGTRFGVDRTVTVSVAGSGKSGTVDFAEVADFPVTVPAGKESGTGTFVLRPEDDEHDELDETVEVGGCLREAEVGACLDFEVTSAQVTVTDNDDLSLSVRDVVVREDAGEAVFTLKLSHPSERTIEVGATYMDGTARRGEDYRATERRVVFARGKTEGELRVALVNDSVMEEDEIFTVRFGPGEGSTELSAVLARCTIIDDDLIDGRRRKLEYALASFGRTMVRDLATAMEDRSGSAASGTTATLAGMPLVSLRSEEGVYGALRRYVGPDGDLLGAAAWRELLSRSSFQLSLGGEGEAAGSGAGAPLVLWGRGSRSWSAGRMDPEVTTRGEVLSGQLGLELRVREDTSLGVMLSGSAGEVELDGALDAEVETELVSVHPYAQWSPRRGLRTWAMLGYGAGEATLTDGFSTRTGAGIETDIEMMMAAAGGSNEVASLRGVDWSVGTSGFFVQLDADGQGELLPALESEVWQVRLLLEGSAGEDFGGVEGLRGNVELAARVDGGDAESGVGMELGGGVGYGRADLGLEVEASGRVLLSHEEEGLEDAGVSLGLEFDPGEPGRGVYFALTPSWGNAASGARAVWEGQQASTGGPHGPDGRDQFDPQMRLSSELGYTTPAPTRRGTLTSYGAFSSDDGAARQYRIGRRLELAGIASMSLEAERRESAGVVPEHGIWLRGSIRY